jgi:hypothetical protein
VSDAEYRPRSRHPFPKRGGALPILPGGEWLSPAETRRILGIGRIRLELMAAGWRLETVENTRFELGYARTSVESEANWRATSTRWGRLRRALVDLSRSP